MPELDYVQQHDYTLRDPMQHYAAAARDWAADGIHGKPLVAGELGLETAYDPKAARPFNWDAVHLHNGLWAPLFNGFAGTALYWWWDHMVDPQGVWPAYRGIARYLQTLHATGLRLARHRPHAARFGGGAAHALALAGERSVLLWVRADLHDAGALRQAWRASTGGTEPARPWLPSYPVIDGGRVQLDGLPLPDGHLQVRWFDAGSGEHVATADAELRAGTLQLVCPAFARDLAAIAQRP
jgi:hypothetical protein